jgi:hypothetical protein
MSRRVNVSGFGAGEITDLVQDPAGELGFEISFDNGSSGFFASDMVQTINPLPIEALFWNPGGGPAGVGPVGNPRIKAQEKPAYKKKQPYFQALGAVELEEPGLPDVYALRAAKQSKSSQLSDLLGFPVMWEPKEGIGFFMEVPEGDLSLGYSVEQALETARDMDRDNRFFGGAVAGWSDQDIAKFSEVAQLRKWGADPSVLRVNPGVTIKEERYLPGDQPVRAGATQTVFAPAVLNPWDYLPGLGGGGAWGPGAVNPRRPGPAPGQLSLFDRPPAAPVAPAPVVDVPDKERLSVVWQHLEDKWDRLRDYKRELHGLRDSLLFGEWGGRVGWDVWSEADTLTDELGIWSYRYDQGMDLDLDTIRWLIDRTNEQIKSIRVYFRDLAQYYTGSLPAEGYEKNPSSAHTARSQVPAMFRRINFEPGRLNLDMGSGPYNKGADYLEEQGVINYSYDPYNLDRETNQSSLAIVQSAGGADTVTVANTLNVIKNKQDRAALIEQAAGFLSPGGVAFFQVYEGDKSGKGRKTGPDSWQSNKPAAGYMKELEPYFGSVERRGSVLIAMDPKRAANPDIRFPPMPDREGMIVQSVLFPVEGWTDKKAKKWLKENDFKAPKVDKGATVLRYRQVPPGKIEPGTFSTIPFGDSEIQAVVGIPKGGLVANPAINPYGRTTKGEKMLYVRSAGPSDEELFSSTTGEKIQYFFPGSPGSPDKSKGGFWLGSRYLGPSFESASVALYGFPSAELERKLLTGAVGAFAAEKLSGGGSVLHRINELPSYESFVSSLSSKDIQRLEKGASSLGFVGGLPDLYDELVGLAGVWGRPVRNPAADPRFPNPPVSVQVAGATRPLDFTVDTTGGEILSSADFGGSAGLVVGPELGTQYDIRQDMDLLERPDFSTPEEALEQFLGANQIPAVQRGEKDDTGVLFEGVRQFYDRRTPLTTLNDTIKYIVRKGRIKRWDDFPVWLVQEMGPPGYWSDVMLPVSRWQQARLDIGASAGELESELAQIQIGAGDRFSLLKTAVDMLGYYQLILFIWGR